MINLKVSVEDALNRMDKEGKRIITLAYFDSCKSDQISEILGVSLRTYFRKKAMAFNKFTQIIKEIGYDESFFEMEYSQEKWFMAIYNDRVIKGITTEEVPDKRLVKEMFNELSKFNIVVTDENSDSITFVNNI